MFTDLMSLLSGEHLWEFVKQQLNSNQFSQGALVAGLVGIVLTWGKSIPGRIWHGIKKLATIEMRYNSDSPDYEAISRFITQKIVKDTFSRNFVFQTEIAFDHEDWKEVAKHRGLTIGYGTHFGVYKGRPVLVHRFVDESANTSNFKEHTVVTFLTRSKATVYRFSEEIARAAGSNVDTFESVPVYVNSEKHWDKMGKLPLRQIESVFTAGNAGQKVIDAIREFERSKAEHHRLGLPHHMGIMLYGDPGCGKSSLIHAVASETQRSIYYLNLGSVEADKQLMKLLSGSYNWSKSILAIEDIDAAGVKVNRDGEDGEESKSPISLSALLNVLDGILCPDGLVVIATTNHHDRLDPALTRPGRFDHTIELGKLGHADFTRMARMFNRDPADFNVSNDIQMSGAEMRALLLEAA
jgi:hypothetical protein